MSKQNRFTSAPKDLTDISYLVGVCEGRRAPDACAYTLISGANSPPVDPEIFKDRDTCYNVGYEQGFWVEFGGRVEVPTPPTGMPRAFLGLFAAGVLDGAEAATQHKLGGSNSSSGSGGSNGRTEPLWEPIVDPFADIHSDETPGTDPADGDLDGDDDDDETPGGNDHV